MKICFRVIAVFTLAIAGLVLGCADGEEGGVDDSLVEEEVETDPSAPEDMGIPDIELQYENIVGPDAAVDCVDGVCTMPGGYHFGLVCTGDEATLSLMIRNTAVCDDAEVDDACTHCALRLGGDGAGEPGIAFEPGTNNEAAFSLVEPSSTTLAQASDACAAANEAEVLVSFSPAGSEGDYSSVLVIRSNDPDEATIKLPLTGAFQTGPSAIASTRICGELDANGNLMDISSCNSGVPFDLANRIYLDGARSTDADGTRNLVAYHWEMIGHPENISLVDLGWTNTYDQVSSFWPPVAGVYVVRLTVWSESGLQSCPGHSSDLALSVVGP